MLLLAREAILGNTRFGLLTARQFNVLKFRARGLSQLETAVEMNTTRANISMIESRAKRKIARARDTIRAYESVLTSHSVVVEVGTRLQEVPSIVLQEGDKYGIHLKSNLIDIIRMVKSIKRNTLKNGRTVRKLYFSFNQKGKLTLS